MLEAIPLSLTDASKNNYIIDQLFNFDSMFSDFADACDKRCGMCQQCMKRKLIVAHNLCSPKAVAWEVWDDESLIGILWLSNIVPEHDARGEFTFWDRRLHGKQNLLENWLQEHVFGQLGLHRVTVEIPHYMFKLGRYLERYLSFEKEGTKREGMYKKGQWYDIHIYGRISDARRHRDNDNNCQFRSNGDSS